MDLLGRNNEARDAYVEVIKREPDHLGALGGLGTLLYNSGFRSAARLTYWEALKHHPDDLNTLVNLGNALLEAADLDEACALYRRAIAIDREFAAAHQGLSHALERIGRPEEAERPRRIGFSLLPVSVSPFRGEGTPVSLLLLSSAFRGNVPVDAVFDDRTFLIARLFTDYYDAELPLPPHDAIVNGIGDADLCGTSLAAAQRLLERANERAINAPALVMETGRATIARRLQGIEGLIVPSVEEFARNELERVERFPVLLRVPGFHTGERFERVGSREELPVAAKALTGERVLAIEPLDARGPDGTYRKYRVLVVGGAFFPVHLARSSQWKVHYFSADLVRTPEAIAEERAFLTDFRSAIGERASRALQAAAERIALDYFGIDFGLDRDGNALLFEANATMRAVVPAASDGDSARRRAAVAANAAFRELALARAAALADHA